MTTVKAGTLRNPQSPAEYLSRGREYVHRDFLRQSLTALAAEYRALFEKEQQERAAAVAALGADLVRAHERIGDLERALESYRAGTWEARAQLRWARVKLAVRRRFAREAGSEARVLDRLPVMHEAEPFDVRD